MQNDQQARSSLATKWQTCYILLSFKCCSSDKGLSNPHHSKRKLELLYTMLQNEIIRAVLHYIPVLFSFLFFFILVLFPKGKRNILSIVHVGYICIYFHLKVFFVSILILTVRAKISTMALQTQVNISFDL